jgi:hypothetical protein
MEKRIKDVAAKNAWEKANPPKSFSEAAERYGYAGAAKWLIGMSNHIDLAKRGV